MHFKRNNFIPPFFYFLAWRSPQKPLGQLQSNFCGMIQNCVRWSQLPTKMAAKLKNRKKGGWNYSFWNAFFLTSVKKINKCSLRHCRPLLQNNLGRGSPFNVSYQNSSFIDWCYYTQMGYTGSCEPLVSLYFFFVYFLNLCFCIKSFFVYLALCYYMHTDPFYKTIWAGVPPLM
jgi:hypothetical protein